MEAQLRREQPYVLFERKTKIEDVFVRRYLRHRLLKTCEIRSTDFGSQ